MLASCGRGELAPPGSAPAPAASGAVSCIAGLTLSGVWAMGARALRSLAVELPAPSPGSQAHCARSLATHAALTASTRAGFATAPFLQRLQSSSVAAFEHLPVNAIQAHGSLLEATVASSC